MTPYDFRCPACGRTHEVRVPMGTAGDWRPCPRCGGEARRVWTVPKRHITRSRGWNLRPGEAHKSLGGLAYDDFGYELERAELADDSRGAYDSPDSRARRQAQLDAEDAAAAARGRTMAQIDADLTPDQHQRLHEWGRAAYAQLHPEDQ